MCFAFPFSKRWPALHLLSCGSVLSCTEEPASICLHVCAPCAGMYVLMYVRLQSDRMVFCHHQEDQLFP